jgi:hypothetical protein
VDRKGKGKMESVGVVVSPSFPPTLSFDLGISCTPITTGAVNLNEMFRNTEVEECVDDVSTGVIEGVVSDEVDAEMTKDQTKEVEVLLNFFVAQFSHITGHT